MNPTQTQSSVATIIAFIAGILAGKGVFGLDTGTWTTLLGGAAGLGMAIWTAIVTRKKAIVQQVNAMPEVAGVLTQPTMAGKALADSIPSSTVVPAGTTQAAAIAKPV